MRLALLADIHGNSHALDAVLADVDRDGPVDGYLVLGDLCAIGHDPIGVLERLTMLSGAVFVRGNTDRYLVTGERPPAPADPAGAAEMYAGFDWTTEVVSKAGWLGWIGDLRLESRIDLPDGTRVLAVHASPGMDEGSGFTDDQSDEDARTLVEGCAADLVLVAHTHLPFDRTVRGVRVFNPGPISNPRLADRRARYALLDADQTRYALTPRAVDYDRQAAIQALHASGFPGANFVAGQLRAQ